ncbi:hypothetical protein HRG_014544 [Hirsutella rhossiliensis]
MPREHPVTVSPEEVRRTLGDLESQRSQQRRSYQRPSPLIRVPTTRSSASCTIWTASAPKNDPAAVKLNSNIPHTRNSRTTHPREEQAPSTPPPTQPKHSLEDKRSCQRLHHRDDLERAITLHSTSHAAKALLQKTRAAAGRSIAETTQRRGDTSHSTPHAANALLQKTHADAGLSITESIQGGTTASPFIAHTDGALPHEARAYARNRPTPARLCRVCATSP